MPCYDVRHGWRSQHKNPKTGKRPITFKRTEALVDMPVDVACGQCIGCRLERSRQWAVRCMHEASLHEYNCFITLTYDEDQVPSDFSLKVEHFQKFMKRLRFKFGAGIRFFHCGEYGDLYGRPHYHAIIFNHDFYDKELFNIKKGVNLYTSKDLQELWPYGFSTVGDVTFESAAYVARYVTKKVTGEAAKEHYGDRKPEYVTMSRRPGIAKAWFDKFKDDVFPHDFVLIRKNMKVKPPRYYDGQYELTNPDDFRRIKAIRKKRAAENPDNTDERLEVRHNIKKLQAKRLKRSLETQI